MIIRVKKQVSFENLMFTLALLCVSSYAFLEHTSIAIPIFSALKLPLLYVGAVCVLSQINLQIRNFAKVKYFYVWVLVISLILMLLVSLYINRNPMIGSMPLRTTIRLILYLLELFTLMIWCAEKARSQYVINFLYTYLLVLAIVTDVFLLTKIVTFRNGGYEAYLVGTKFSVAYLHMNLLAFWMLKRKNENTNKVSKINWILALSLVGISAYVDCLTGVLGAIALLLILQWMKSQYLSKLLRLTSPRVLLAALVGTIVFAIVAQQIIAIPVVSYFISSILDRSLTLTGRTNVFEMFGKKMYLFWLWGCGVGNGNAAATRLFGYDNTQNAILQWLLQTGIFSTALLIGLMLYIFHQLSRSNKQEKVLPLVVLIYVYIIMGMVETTFNMSFIMWFAIIFMLVNEKQKQ